MWKSWFKKRHSSSGRGDEGTNSNDYLGMPVSGSPQGILRRASSNGGVSGPAARRRSLPILPPPTTPEQARAPIPLQRSSSFHPSVNATLTSGTEREVVGTPIPFQASCFQSISVMDEYNRKSFEELRLEDMSRMKKVRFALSPTIIPIESESKRRLHKVPKTPKPPVVNDQQIIAGPSVSREPTFGTFRPLPPTPPRKSEAGHDQAVIRSPIQNSFRKPKPPVPPRRFTAGPPLNTQLRAPERTPPALTTFGTPVVTEESCTPPTQRRIVTILPTTFTRMTGMFGEDVLLCSYDNPSSSSPLQRHKVISGSLMSLLKSPNKKEGGSSFSTQREKKKDEGEN